MKNQIIKYFFIVPLCIMALGCYKDLGNYDYLEKNSIQISNIDTMYTMITGSVLELKPQIVSKDGANTQDTSRFVYHWYNEFPTGQIIDMGANKDLTVNITSERFTVNRINNVYFTVIDKLTAARSQYIVQINVITETAFAKRGWYALSDVNGGSQLSLISHANNTTAFYKDALLSTGSALNLQEQGIPLSLGVNSFWNLFISTSKNSFYVPINNGLEWTQNQLTTSFFAQALPSNSQIQFVKSLDIISKEANVVFANNNYYAEALGRDEMFGRAINKYTGETNTFKASEYFGSFWQERALIMYDLDNKQFAQFTLSLTEARTIPLLSLRDETNTMRSLPTGKDLRYMAKTRYTGERGQVYAILKSNQGEYSLIRLEGRLASGRTYAVIKAAEEPITATDFDKAEHITINPVYGYIYYNVGSKVYAYDPIGTKSSKQMLDLGNEKISVLKFDESNNASFLVDNRETTKELEKLVVATYNPTSNTSTSGKITFYTVPSAMGNITQVGDSYSGMGIIKDICYVRN